MNIPHKQLNVDINRKNQYTVDFIGHVNDKDVRYIDVTFNAGGTPITLEEGCTATVTYVSEGVLIDQAAVCTVTGSTVVIGVDSEKVENLRSGILEVQPKVVDPNGRVLTMQIPILVRISPDIAEHGQVDDGSLGSYAEVVREIAVARKGYESIGERMDNIGNPTDEQVAEGVEEYFEEHPSALVAGNSIWQTTTAPTAPAAPENPGYGFAISNLIGGDRDVQIGDVVLYSYYYYNITSIIGSIAYAETRVSIRGAKGSTGAKGDPGDDYVLTAQDKVEIAGMVDISGKEDTIHKKSAISGQSQTGDDDTFYPTVGAVRNYTDGKVTELEGYVDDELDDMDTAKADKATTLAGYGITDGYKRIAVLSSVINNCDNPDTIYFVTVNNPQTSIIPVNDGESVLVLCNKLSANNLIQYGLTLDGRILTRKKVNGTWESKFNDIIPTKTSQLNNDSGFLTQHQDISGKADKATTYTKDEVNTAIQTAIGGIENGSY